VVCGIILFEAAREPNRKGLTGRVLEPGVSIGRGMLDTLRAQLRIGHAYAVIANDSVMTRLIDKHMIAFIQDAEDVQTVLCSDGAFICKPTRKRNWPLHSNIHIIIIILQVTGSVTLLPSSAR
jgi:hypothetical protein